MLVKNTISSVGRVVEMPGIEPESAAVPLQVLQRREAFHPPIDMNRIATDP